MKYASEQDNPKEKDKRPKKKGDIRPKENDIRPLKGKCKKTFNVNEGDPGVGHLMDNDMQRNQHPAARAPQGLCER